MKQSWEQLCSALLEAGRILDDERAPKDAATQSAGLRYLLNLLNSGLDMVVMSADPERPEIGRPQDTTKRWALDCADALYARAAVAGSGTYRLTGRGGNPHYLGIAVLVGHFGSGPVRTISNLSQPGSLLPDQDGGFSVILSPEKHSGNWLQLDPDVPSSSVDIRQFLYDWDTEEPHHLSIERLDRPPQAEAIDADVVAGQVANLGRFVTGSATLWADFVAGLASTVPNTIGSPNPQASVYGGTPDNAYGSGYFELGPDEAAIIEVQPPPCHYWNMQFGDYWFQSLDYTYRQTSLNGHQAMLDDEGVFRAVLAHDDPGVWNWFDTAGNRILPMTYRWQLWRCPSNELPTPSARTVSFSELDRELPSGTRRITKEERRAVLDRRRRAVLRRFGR